MFKWLFDRAAGKRDLDGYRNAAVAAGIDTIPSDERLARYVRSLPRRYRDAVTASARSIFAAADGLLDEAAKAGNVDLARFHPALDTYLRARFPWATAETLGALKAYTGWYSWHEGYLSSPA